MRKIYPLLLVAISMMLFLGTAATAQLFEHPQLPIARAGFAPGEILVKFRAGASEAQIAALNARHGSAEGRGIPALGVHRLKLAAGRTVEEMVEAYSRSPLVEFAEPNGYVSAHFAPNDSYYSYQWHMDNSVYGGIEMEEAWDLQTGNPSVIIGIIDTGVAYEDYEPGKGEKYKRAPDLNQTIFVPGYDFVNDDTHPNDDHSHGTHVAGTVAQSTNNSQGVAGVAFNCALMPVKVLSKNGMGTTADVAAGIVWAADNGADVINLSLGGAASSTKENAVSYAYNKGVVIVASAGNDGTGQVSYPAGYDAYVIAVGATRYDETLAPYSNYGASLDLVAPGGDTSVDQNNDGYGDGVLQNTFNPTTKNTRDFNYWFFQGTSMAAPHVSGVAALLIAAGVTGPDNVRSILQSTADDLGAAGRDDTYGHGLVNAYKALQKASGPVDAAPAVSIASPANGSTVAGAVTVQVDAADQEDAAGTLTVGVSIDGGAYAAAPYNSTSGYYELSWDTTLESEGSHTIDARATDSGGNAANAAQVSVTVDNVDEAPAVSIASPANGSTVSGAVTVQVDASDDRDAAGALLVEVSIDGGAYVAATYNLGSGYYELSWDTTTETDGSHTLDARAADSGGNAANAAQVSVTVDNSVKVVKVAGIDPWTEVKGKSGKVKLFIQVAVVDGGGVPVSSAEVDLTLNAPDGTFAGSGFTGSDGTVTFEKGGGNAPDGSYTATVTDIAKSGYTFDPTNNTRSFAISGGQVQGAVASAGSEGSPVLLVGAGGAPGATLSPSSPNPSNPETAIRYTLDEAGRVTLRIYNALGQEVRMLVDQVQIAGTYTVRWDGKDDAGIAVASGVYFYQLYLDGRPAGTQKLMLAR